MTGAEKRKAVTDRLAALGIFSGPHGNTAEEYVKTDKNSEESSGIEIKNLFLKEHNSDNYFLISMRGGKNADIKSLRKYLGTKPLSFASEEQLKEKLDVTYDEISPLAVINDRTNSVSLIIDDSLRDGTLMGFYHNESSSMIFLTYDELEKYAESCGHMLINMQV